MNQNITIIDNDLHTWCINNKKMMLLEEWDYEKNKITPLEITVGSTKSFWWKCSKGHEWRSRVGNRTYLDRGCPYCSGSKTLKGYNDLKTWCINNSRLDLISEWNSKKNIIEMDEISAHNSKKVWWNCTNGHEWQATVGSRTNRQRPSSCPYCTNKKVLVGYNDFETWCENNNREYLLKEWNCERNASVTFQDVTYGSGKRVWWKCAKGHEWRAQINNRVYGNSCPICTRTQTSFPEQALSYYLAKKFDIMQRYRIKGFEIDIYLIKYNIAIEYDGRYFHSTKQSQVREKQKNIFFDSEGITLIRIKENKEKNSVEGNVIYYIPTTNYLDDNFDWAIHQLIKILEQKLSKKFDLDINLQRDQLYIRAYYMDRLKSDSVAVCYPNVAEEWDIEKNNGMTPDNFASNSHVKVWWRCKSDHSWMAEIASRTSSGRGCPYCAGQKNIIGVNDLETWCKNNNEELLSEWNYDKNSVLPSEIAFSSNVKVWWKCTQGHEWQALIGNRVHGNGCPECFRTKKIRYNISLAEWCKETNNHTLLNEWNYEKNGFFTPDMLSKGSHKKVWWKCAEGHEWQAVIKSRTYNHGCPYCSGTNKRAQKGVNDLVTWCKANGKEYILDEWNYDKNDQTVPEMVTKGSHKRVWWKCTKGHEWEAVVKERTKVNGNRCPFCRKDDTKIV